MVPIWWKMVCFLHGWGRGGVMKLIERMLAERAGDEGERVELRAERRKFLKRRWRGVAEDGREFGFDDIEKHRLEDD